MVEVRSGVVADSASEGANGRISRDQSWLHNATRSASFEAIVASI